MTVLAKARSSVLTPLAATLAIFDPRVAAALGALAGEVLRLLPAPRFRDRTDEGDPDGYDDLARRGSYERLLMSEWLLATEAPDEFIRRAASGEHAFLRRAFRAKAASRRSFALVDGGPDVLGAPRVVLAATLVALAARARAASASFAWAVAQDPDRRVREGFDDEGFAALLAARVRRGPRADDVAAFVPPKGDEEQDSWVVGGGVITAHRTVLGGGSVRIDDTLDEGPPAVCVTATTSRGEIRSTNLTVPPGAVSANVLASARDAAGGPLTARFVDATPCVASSDGRLIHGLGRGGVLVTAGAEAKRTSLAVYAPPAGSSILAVGQQRAGKRPVVLTVRDDDHLVLTQLRRNGTEGTQVLKEVDAGAFARTLPAPHLGRMIAHDAYWDFVDGRGRLVRIEDEAAHVIGEGVVAARAGLFLETIATQPTPGSYTLDAGTKLPTLRCALSFAAAHLSYAGAFDLCGLVDEGGRSARIRHQQVEQAVALDPTDVVVGVVGHAAGRPLPALVVRTSSPNRLELVSATGRDLLVEHHRPIVNAVAPPELISALVFLDADGELTLFSASHRTVLRRWRS